jgi:hypothetical protein
MVDSAAGVASLRSRTVWFAVHRAATHPRDARYDVGLLAGHVERGRRWLPVLGERPNTDDESRAPSSGPLLQSHGRTLQPSGNLAVTRDTIVLRGAWRSGGSRVPATWRYGALRDGVELLTPCPARARLRLIEWIPDGTRVRLGARSLLQPERVVTVSSPVRMTWLPDMRASAGHERLRGVRLDLRCTGRPVRIAWRVR